MDKVTFFTGSTNRIIADKKNNLSFPALIHYPTLEPSAPTKFGPYTMDVASDATIADGKFPMAIISHGNSSSHLIYHTISTYLAKKGFIVVSIEHYGNNRNNNELGHRILNLEYRPRHLSLTIGFLLSDSIFYNHIDQDKIAIIGHSFGGYSALAVAGGQPWTASGEKVNIKKDSRVKAIVAMAPAAGYFMPANSLSDVDTPILLITAELDSITTKKWTSEIILQRIPAKSLITHKEIPKAGHFSFISPFPNQMRNAKFLPSTDPPGFDRDRFHEKLPTDIFNYLHEIFNAN